MNPSLVVDNQSFCKLLSRVSAIFAIAVGSTVLTGWLFKIAVLKSIIPNFVSMNPMTAVSFIMLGSALLVHHSPYNTLRYAIATACALSVLLLASSRLADILGGFDFSLDQLLFPSRLGTNHMAPNTAFNFVILSMSLLFLRCPRNPHRHFLILLAILISFMALIGYAYDINALYKISAYISMALNTAFTFFVLSWGLLCFEPDYGLMRVLANKGISGFVTRRIFPQAIITLVVLGWLRLTGQRLGLYDAEIGVLVFLFLVIIVFGILIYYNAIVLERIDIDRQRKANELKEAHDKLQVLSLTDPLTGVFNRRGLETHAERHLKLARRNNHNAFLFFIDIDKMKWINDTLGHKEGDAVLIEVANILKACFRDTDVIARLGGDEFGVLVTLNNDGDENIIIKRLQDRLAQRNEMYRSSRHPFSLSIGGVLCNPQESCDLEALMAQADKKMYIQKKSKKTS